MAGWLEERHLMIEETIMKKVLMTEKCRGKTISLDDYTHIRAYHACRIENIEAYKKNGIVPFTKQSAIKDAVKKLSDERLSEDEVRKQAEETWKERNIHKVWLGLEQSELLGDACHYLIYGSEFLNAVAAQLWCRDKLKAIGKPTIVVCDVPLNTVSDTWMTGLEQAVKKGEASIYSIAVNRVSPEDIIEFIFPTGYVKDPYLGYANYKLR